MHADGRTVPDGEKIHTDVCIVGGGPAGITLARELDRAGREVVLLERGPADGPGLTQPMGTTDCVGIDYDIDFNRGSGLGGSTHRWDATTPLGEGFGRLREFDPDDFEARAWVPHSGWPFARSELDPYYPAARELFRTEWQPRLPGEHFDETFDFQIPVDRLVGVQPRLFTLADASVFGGLHSRELDRSERVLMLTRTAAVELSGPSGTGDVDSLIAATAPDHRFEVVASRYVLAAGAIETARLLLNSQGNNRSARWNEHDLVGRFFMEHPGFPAAVLVPRDPQLLERRNFYDFVLHDGMPIQVMYRLAPELVAREGLPNHLFHFVANPWSVKSVAAEAGWSPPRRLDALHDLRARVRQRTLPERPVAAARRVGAELPEAWRAVRTRQRLRRRQPPTSGPPRPAVLSVEMTAEQQPNPASRIMLRGGERDQFGVPRATLDWRFVRDDTEGFARSVELFGHAVSRAGLGRVHSYLDPDEIPRALRGAAHHMGTTRMHDDARSGVVDRRCRVHGLGNVYVAGSSVFPTGGMANPTLTVLALTLRLRDELVRGS
jgi:choline dehydrogenase-like flavoprotein